MKEYDKLRQKMFKDRQTFIDEEGDYWAVGDMENYTGAVKGIAIDKLAYLEDKIENGTLIELPCKVGTTVYYIGSLEVRAFFKIKTIHDIVEMPFSLDMLDSYKIVWFTTKAEAEKKLEELNNENTRKQ